MSPKPKHELAREHLNRATRAIEEDDIVVAITFLHLAAEAAVVTLAESEGIDGVDVLAEDCRDATAWRARIVRDRAWASELLTPELARAAEALQSRAVAAGADAVALTGSTVRGRRTEISDLDLHVIGPRPSLTDIDVELDVYATSVDVMSERLRAGDDYVQWTLRFGCVLFDRGVLRAAATEIVARGLWPSPERKHGQALRLLGLADAVLASGDHDAATEQTRGALTAVARWILLAAGAFPLSRDELPAQLRGVGHPEMAVALQRCIHSEPPLDELAADVSLCRRILESPRMEPAALR